MDTLEFILKIMPIITPLISVAWMVHKMDKRISILETEYQSLDSKLEKIYLILFNRGES